MAYEKTIGRLTLHVGDEGMKQSDYGYGASIECRKGWNKDSESQMHIVSIEELRDLRYLIERALAAVEDYRGRH